MKATSNILEDIEIEKILRKRVFQRIEPVKMITHKKMLKFFKKRSIEDI